MAAFAKSIGNAVLNTRADQVVFADKETQADLFQTEKADSSKSSAGGRDTPITPKDFYWDQILFYLISAILGLSFLDLSVEFFRGSVIQCFIPDSVESRDQIAYLNNYCYGSLPNSQYYLIFILISAVFIIAPHYLWMSYFGAHFDFFFDLVKKLNRLRDTDTGEYSSYNFELVKKLEQKFSSSNPWIFRLYKLKLVTQLLFCLVVQAVNAFYFKETDFSESFSCPTHSTTVNSSVWPIATQVTCVYNSLTLLYFLRNTALVLISAAVIVIIIGLFWCYLRHTNELGAKDIAAFCDVSCLPPEEYPFPSARKVIRKILCCGKKERSTHGNLTPKITNLDEEQTVGDSEEDKDVDEKPEEDKDVDEKPEEGKDVDEQPICCPCFSGFWNGLVEAFCPRITTDLDFLVMRLFYADSGHGQVFKDIQIYKELKQKVSRDHELLYLLGNIHDDMFWKYIDDQTKYSKEGVHTAPAPRLKKDWERFEDLKSFFFQSGFTNTSPEKIVYSYFESDLGVIMNDWSLSPLKDALFGFLKFAPENKLAFDISFGNKTGYSLILARAFTEAVTIHFNKFYQNPEQVVKNEQYESYRTLTFQADIFSQTARNIWKSEMLIADLFKETKYSRKIDLIVIGPMTDRSNIVTANLLVEKLYSRRTCFRSGAILLAVRPLMIGSKPRTDHFIQYQPPKGIFKELKDKVHAALADGNVPVFSVSPKGETTKLDLSPVSRATSSTASKSNGLCQRINRTFSRPKSMNKGAANKSAYPYGISVLCNNVPCIYEFRVFRCIGRYGNEGPVGISTLPPPTDGPPLDGPPLNGPPLDGPPLDDNDITAELEQHNSNFV